MTRHRPLLGALIATCALISPQHANADLVISYNWDNNGTVGGSGAGSGPIAGEFAGVVPAEYWYNSFPDNPNTNLVDSNGNATTMDIGWFSANGTFSVTGSQPASDDPPADTSWNQAMLNGYLNSGGGPVVGITLSQIPFAQYDVYVYFNADVAGREGFVLGQERASDTDPFINQETFYFSTNAVIDSFVETTDITDDLVDTPANYAVFSGTLSTFNVETQIPDFGGIAGIQVVEVIPEPSGVVLSLLGGVLWLRRHAR